MKPRLIEFPVHKDPTGDLAVADYDDLPFGVKRVFWVYDMKGNRGDHTLKTCHQLIVPLSGVIEVATRYEQMEELHFFLLEEKHIGLYLPPMIYRQIAGILNSSFFVLCSHPFDEDDYIDGIADFEKALMTSEMEKGLKFADE